MTKDVNSQEDNGLNADLGAPSIPEPPAEADTGFEGYEADVEDAFAAALGEEEQAPASEPDTPEPAPETEGEDADAAQAQEQPQADPAAAEQAEADTSAPEDSFLGRYRTREDAEAGLHEKDSTITRQAQELAEARQLLNQFTQMVQQQPQQAQPTPQNSQTPPAPNVNDLIQEAMKSVDPNAFYDDPAGTMQKVLGSVLPGAVEAAQKNATSSMEARLEMQRQADARRAEVKAIAERGDKYIADKYPALKEGAGKAIGEGIIARLLAPHVPDAQLAPEQRQARHDFLHDPQKFADGVANIAKPYLEGLQPKSQSDPRETTEVLEGGDRQLKASRSEVKQPPKKQDTEDPMFSDGDEWSDVRREQERYENSFGVW